MKFSSAGIVWNASKKAGLECADGIFDMLKANGVKVYADEVLKGRYDCDPLAKDGSISCDMLIVLGGDGTILNALGYSIKNDIPILGVNLGRIGFLAELEAEKAVEGIKKVLDGDFRIEERMLLSVEGMENLYALNDIVIARLNAVAGVLSVEVSSGDTLIDRVSGDGMIVATPTGSTAYSLSAGGPVVSPELECLVITPVCPHTMNTKCVVTGTEKPLKMRVLDRPEQACIVFDGYKTVNMSSELDRITVRKSDKRARFIRIREHNYFELLHRKLSEWTH